MRAKEVVQELARSRLSNSLVQAVALLRQRNHPGVVNFLNDLLACNKAVRSTPLSWKVPEDLSDLFLVYLKSDPSPENLVKLQYLLNISDSTSEALRAMKDR
ncbi:protein TIC [Forsythia ovata]|uniref:Protein TIC n=1 Tax=Forsythia ovata TaxID=205694 RepID=A0ABD1PYQ1_9LAMI